MNAQYVWFLIFGVLAYIIVTDPNVAKAYNYVLELANTNICLLYTSPSPRDATLSRMPSSA